MRGGETRWLARNLQWGERATYFMATRAAVVLVGFELLAAVGARRLTGRTAEAALLVCQLKDAAADGAGDDVCEEGGNAPATEAFG